MIKAPEGSLSSLARPSTRQAFESAGVELVVGDYHPIAVTVPQDLASQLLPEKRHIALQSGPGRLPADHLTRPLR